MIAELLRKQKILFFCHVPQPLQDPGRFRVCRIRPGCQVAEYSRPALFCQFGIIGKAVLLLRQIIIDHLRVQQDPACIQQVAGQSASGRRQLPQKGPQGLSSDGPLPVDRCQLLF